MEPTAVNVTDRANACSAPATAIAHLWDVSRNMQPLDHQNRDWTMGNCLFVALEYIKDSEGLIAEGAIAAGTPIHLIHGTISFDGKTIKHAWIEEGDYVLDHANNNSIRCSKGDYYSRFDASPKRKFTRMECDAILTYHNEREGEFNVVFWDELTDTQIAEYVNAFSSRKSLFSRGIAFCNPTDETNRTNLQGG